MERTADDKKEYLCGTSAAPSSYDVPDCTEALPESNAKVVVETPKLAAGTGKFMWDRLRAAASGDPSLQSDAALRKMWHDTKMKYMICDLLKGPNPKLPMRIDGDVRERVSRGRMNALDEYLCEQDSCTSSSKVKVKDEFLSEQSVHSLGVNSLHTQRSVEVRGEICAGVMLDMCMRKGKGTVDAVLESLENDKGTRMKDYAIDAVKRDVFLASIWEDLTEFFKQSTSALKSNYAWPQASTSAIRDHVKRIIETKRLATCLKAEVGNYLIRYKLLNTAAPARFETVRERHDRMEDFWVQFHGKCRRNELPPINRRDCNELSPSGRSKSRPFSATRPGSVKGKKNICFAEEEQWNMIRRIEVQNRNLASIRETSPQASRAGTSHSTRGPSAMALATRNSRAPTSSSASRNLNLDSPKLRKRLGKDLEPISSGQCSVSKSASAPTLSTTDLLSPKGGLLPPLHSGPLQSGSMALRLQEDDDVLSTLPTDAYLEACQRCWIVPTPLPFVTGHSWRLNAAGRNLMDSDLRAMAVMLQEMPSIEEVDLGGNVLLTEKALVPFVERLFGEPASSTLQKLNFRECKHIGSLAMDTIRRLLSDIDGALNLKSLDLSHVQIPMKCHITLSKAIKAHKALDSLNLSDTALGGNSWLATQCVEFMMSCPTLIALDLSWNCFDVTVFQHLGKMTAQKQLKMLAIANCSSAVIDVFSPAPISFFLEYLQEDSTLTRLDVSLNRMDFRCMLIIEDCLEFHSSLSKLDLSHNPLGVLGMRSALRLLARSSSALVHIEVAESYTGSVVGAQTFNFVNPGGHYELDLEKPYNRTLLRMLYKQCEKFHQPPERCFLGLSYTKPPWRHCGKDSKLNYDVPNSGRVSFSFNLEVAFEKNLETIAGHDFSTFIDNHMVLTKLQPGFNKVVPLMANWKQLDGHAVDQIAFLQAMSKDFFLTPGYFEVLCRTSSMLKSSLICGLLPCIVGGVAARNLCLQVVPTIGEFIGIHQKMRTYLDLNIENPTGHYKLHLDRCSDHAVAMQLLLLNQWEIVVSRKNKRQDVSQRNNASHIRNETYRDRPLHLQYRCITDWNLKEVDTLEFDYISGKRCPIDAPVLNSRTFRNILVSLFDAECTSHAKLEVIRMVSHHMFLKAKQFREILGMFRDAHDRIELFIILFLQCVDMCNAKVFKVRFASDAELRELGKRLGFATFFPFIQPENASFDLDFQFHDQRLCLNMLMTLAEKEGWQNIHDPEYIRGDGTVDKLEGGIPRRWLKLNEIQDAGNFKCKYMCAPENRKFSLRTSLAETIGSFRMNVNENEVMWWTGLQEPPEDVLDFLEFLLGKFDDPMKAFTFIDGEDGNGVITLREFEDGLRELQCKKFQGKDEAHRILMLFRYLDPGEEGTVSKDEWGILGQLWQEYQLSITEFVHFLQRTFGDDLNDAWQFLDDDGSGELTFEEFMSAVEKIGYFGPARCVFSLLDTSDDGSISLDEWIALDKYKAVHKS